MAAIQNLDALRETLSSGATIDTKGDPNYAKSAARWSDLNAPTPGAVINVASEADIGDTVSPIYESHIPSSRSTNVIRFNGRPSTVCRLQHSRADMRGPAGLK
jgi:hypothetical protein